MLQRTIAAYLGFIPKTVPQAKQALEILKQDINKAKTYSEIRKAEKAAEVLKALWDQIDEVRQAAELVVLAAKVRIGEEEQWIKESGRGAKKGGGGNQVDKANRQGLPISTQAERGKPRDLNRAQTLAERGKSAVEAAAKALHEAGKAATESAVLSFFRKEAKEEKKQAVANAVFSGTGPFDVVVIDPPWQMEKIDREVRPNQAEFDYPTMSEEQLRDWWPTQMADKVKKDCHLFCWTTQRFLPAALRLVESWGFRYVLVMVWHKPGGFQPIDLPQYNCEFCVYARKGSPLFIDTKDFNCCFEAPRLEHSRKPAVFYELIKRVTGGSRIDIFSREAHDGFAQFGNEIGKFDEK